MICSKCNTALEEYDDFTKTNGYVICSVCQLLESPKPTIDIEKALRFIGLTTLSTEKVDLITDQVFNTSYAQQARIVEAATQLYKHRSGWSVGDPCAKHDYWIQLGKALFPNDPSIKELQMSLLKLQEV